MPTLSLGSVAGGNYVAPKTNWTPLTIANTSGNYLWGQTGWAMIADIAWVNGAFWITVTSQEWQGVEQAAYYYNSDPVGNPTGWQRYNANGAPGVFSPTPSTFIGYTNGKYYWTQHGYIWYTSTITGTRTQPTTTNGDPLGREGYFGIEYTLSGLASNGSRTILTAMSSNTSQQGEIWRSDDGVSFTRILGNPHGYYGRPVSDVAYLGNNTFVATIPQNGWFMRSTDNGNNWSGPSALPGSDSTTKNYKIASNGAGKAVIRGTYGLWTTTDYGANWTKTFTEPVLSTIYNTQNSPGNSYATSFPHSVEWSADDNCFVYMTGVYQWYSDANGANWTQNTNFAYPTHTGVNAVSICAYSPTLKYWLSVAAKKNSNQFSNAGNTKFLSWTDNIKGI
jgi:hypothetical protein